jgi:hypothetical protein
MEKLLHPRGAGKFYQPSQRASSGATTSAGR